MKLLIVSDAHTDLIFGEEISEKLISGEAHLSEDLYHFGTPQLGGVGANTARAASMLGLYTGLMAVNGTDRFSEARVRALKSCGIDTSLLISDPRPSMTIPVAVSAGERVFLRPLQLSGLSDEGLNIDLVDREHVLSYDMVYSCGVHLFNEPLRTTVLTVLQWFCDAGKPVFFDCNLRRQMGEFTEKNREDFYKVFSMCHTVSGSGIEELCVVTGSATVREACEKILGLGCPNVIAKLGADGADLYDGEQVLRCPALAVPVRDTLGAGDTFAGGFLAGFAEKLSKAECLRKATLAAAYEIQFEGTETMGTAAQLEELDRRYGPIKVRSEPRC